MTTFKGSKKSRPTHGKRTEPLTANPSVLYPAMQCVLSTRTEGITTCILPFVFLLAPDQKPQPPTLPFKRINGWPQSPRGLSTSVSVRWQISLSRVSCAASKMPPSQSREIEDRERAAAIYAAFLMYSCSSLPVLVRRDSVIPPRKERLLVTVGLGRSPMRKGGTWM